uniref:Capsular polysaccharide synthesis protein n=1 Tax=viral metagenome TaxID=1070528 RepID=A0A6C0IJE4_9ZZZZ
MDNIINKNIFVFWTGANVPSTNRINAYKQLINKSECNIILITTQNLGKYILKDHPLHPAYQYLSETQKGDYLKAYMMNFHGGGYSDIKQTTNSWKKSFDKLYNSDKWIIGYRESKIDHIAYKPFANYWRELVGNGGFICKSQTPLTKEWYNDMLTILNIKLNKLKQFPATFPQDCAEVSKGKYPIEWNEINGRIFHRLCYKYKDTLLYDLPEPILNNYR